MAIKLYIQYDKQNRSGKGKFISRLWPELEKLGVKVQWEQAGADIALGLTRWREKTRIPKVLRLDGIHLIGSKHHRWNNKRIKKSMQKADAVIYQSAWGKYMIENRFDIKPKSYVIHNGADPEQYKKTMLVQPWPKNVIMSAKWVSRDDRRQKRLPDMVAIAWEYIKLHDDVCVYIAGKNNLPNYRHERMVNLGYLEEQGLQEWLSYCDVMLNLAWWDWCPNAVVEAICAKCIVVGSDKTGVGELIKLCGGVPLNLDAPISPTAEFPDNRPPSFDYSKVIAGLDAAFRYSRKIEVNPEPLDIRNIAQKYKRVFEDVLNEL